MSDLIISCLRECIARYQAAIPELASVTKSLTTLVAQAEAGHFAPLIQIYDEIFPLLEKALWSDASDFDAILNNYQSLFREQEALIQHSGKDNRYHFILCIPVADRPQHLSACLESIYQLCELFGYGGKTAGVYSKIKVIVAEDSAEENNIGRHIELIHEYRQKGLDVIHLDQAEQFELMQAIPPSQREKLGTILSTQPKEKFYLKGQAANRNLGYLKFLQLTQNKNRTLYYLVDSDQAFCVNRQTPSGKIAAYALNYFYYINKLFLNTPTLMLTGKLVGDPPVSPSVMTSNFLDDVTAFFTELSQEQGKQDCHFHTPPAQIANDAAYHDMANLFGFKNPVTPFRYSCRLAGKHDHSACLRDFSSRLNAFFFGEHLTRKTVFTYDKGFSSISPARTVYPGNYIVNYEGLKYIIPFGHLRLRMSGPTAGRLIQAEIGERFASVNLPMLHRRTTGNLTDDFRPGVALQQQTIDLSNEFERQFFGDLMLFSVADIVTRTDIHKPFPGNILLDVINRKETELLMQYQQKHDAVLEKTRQLNELIFNADHWWLNSPELAEASKQIKVFIHNIEHNFGNQSLAYKQIHSSEHRTQRKKQIIEALMNYRAERDAWDSLF
jgi:hypothetical protein